MNPIAHAAATLAAVVSLTPGVARAVARVELHPFESATLSDHEFLTGGHGTPVVIAGELRIPKPGTDRLPAVVLVHPSGGIVGNVDEWIRLLNGMGVATFVFDSFTPRHIVDTVDDQSRLSRIGTTVDAYRALDLLSTHPRIDPARIALMGFSRGAVATLYASMNRFQRMHGSPSASFAAYVAFYPDCMTTYLQDTEVADRPIRIFHGAADDYLPVAPCREYVERLQHAGRDVRLTEYPGAQHVFDASALRSPLKLPRAQTPRRCRTVETIDGVIVNAETKQRFTYDDPCVERGTTLAHDAAATADAQRQVRELVTSSLLAPTRSSGSSGPRRTAVRTASP